MFFWGGLQVHFTSTRGCDQNADWELQFGFDKGISLSEMKFYDELGNYLTSVIESDDTNTLEGYPVVNVMDDDLGVYGGERGLFFFSPPPPPPIWACRRPQIFHKIKRASPKKISL